MASNIKDLVYKDLDVRMRRMFESPEMTTRLQKMVEDTVTKTFSSDRFRYAIVEAMRTVFSGEEESPPSTPAPTPIIRRRREGPGAVCHVAGCGNPIRAMGYCSAHYQSARKYNWPRPAPMNFSPSK